MKFKKYEKVLLLFDFIFIIYFVIVIYKYMMLTNLEKIGKEYSEKTNFVMEKDYNNDGYISKYIIDCDGKQLLSKYIRYNIKFPNLITMTEYIKDGESYLTNDFDKTYSVVKVSESSEEYKNLYKLNTGNISFNFQEKLLIAILGDIHKTSNNFKDAYYIKYKEIGSKEKEYIVEKDTGLIVQQSTIEEISKINPDTGRNEKQEYKDIQNIKYKFDNVRENEIQKPDLTDYKIEYED